MRSSNDLYTWSDKKTILKPSLPWHSNEYGSSISNPCVIKHKQAYYLYYSASLTPIQDCGFNEPLYIGLAKASNPAVPFQSLHDQIMEPSKFNRWCNIGCGSFKALKMDDGFIGFQNGIYWDYTINQSGSAILVYSSKDGIHYNPLMKELNTSSIFKEHLDWFLLYYMCSRRYIFSQPNIPAYYRTLANSHSAQDGCT